MIRNIIITICTILLFALMAWTTIAATPDDTNTTPQPQVNYDLPYPGILPDSPLYALKALRDKIVSIFITDPKKQAEFDLLQSDKRLAAGQYLLEEQKPNDTLVSETISKGENYFADAITNIGVAKKQGQLVNDFLNTLLTASQKHIEVLSMLSASSHGQLHADLEKDITRMQGYEKSVKKLIETK